MIEFSRLTVLLLSELLVGLTLLSGILLTLQFRRRGKIRKAARHLVAQIQQTKGSRTERLSARLQAAYQYKDHTLEQAVHDLSRAEMHLYQNIINSYIKQDTVAFQRLDADVDKLVMAYQDLNPPGVASAGDGSASSEEVEHLKMENARLTDELRATMDTIGRMLNEYSSAFFSAHAGREEPEDETDESSAEASDTAAELELVDAQIEEAEPTSMEEQSASAINDEADLKNDSEHDNEAAEMPDFEHAAVNLPAHEEDLDSTGLHAESMMDELEQIDIEMLDSAVSDLDDPPAEPGSLEAEWAKLLEEDAASAAAAESEVAKMP